MPPSDAPEPETLTKDLVQHLSKEIETTSNNIMAFRTRIGFSLCIGPFLLLGSLIVGAKGQSVASNFRWYGWPALAVVVICYVGIAYITSEIELQALQQCENWRNIIGEICKNKAMIDLDAIKLSPTLDWRGFTIRGRKWRSFTIRERTWKPDWFGVNVAYRVGYLLLFVAVFAAVFVVRAGSSEPANYASSVATMRIEGATIRIEQITPSPTPSPQVLGSANKDLPKN